MEERTCEARLPHINRNMVRKSEYGGGKGAVHQPRGLSTLSHTKRAILHSSNRGMWQIAGAAMSAFATVPLVTISRATMPLVTIARVTMPLVTVSRATVPALAGGISSTAWTHGGIPAIYINHTKHREARIKSRCESLACIGSMSSTTARGTAMPLVTVPLVTVSLVAVAVGGAACGCVARHRGNRVGERRHGNRVGERCSTPGLKRTLQSAPKPPSGVAVFMSAHSKTRYSIPSMDFPLATG